MAEYLGRISAKHGRLIEHPDFRILNSSALAHHERCGQYQNHNSNWFDQK
jgi:hypothetical protein